MNILHVIPAVAERYGGPSRAVVALCRALAEQNAEVLVAATDADGPGRLSVPLERIIEYEGVPMIFFRRQFSEAFKYSRPLASWVAQHAGRFDLIHIHAIFSHASLAAARAARLAGVPYIVRPLGSLAPWTLRHKPWRKKAFWYLGIHQMLDRAAAIHCTSQCEGAEVKRLIPGPRVAVVPLGVSVPPAGDESVEGNVARVFTVEGPYVLALGRIHPVKGLDVLLRSFDLATRQNQGDAWRLVIAGDGDRRHVNELKNLASRLPCSKKLVFTGWAGGGEKATLLRGAALLAMPSHQENFGISAFEAMSCGVPVLVSRNIDLATTIERAGAGWVCDLEVGSIAGTFRDAMSHSELRQQRGRAGRCLVEAEYTWPVVTGKLIGLYNDILGERMKSGMQRPVDASPKVDVLR